jgi:hypothetical protein
MPEPTDKPTFEDPLVEKFYQSGLQYIEKIRAANKWEDGILVMPFTCYGCAKPRTDFCMTTGDGLPMCVECFDKMASTISGQPAI